MNVKKGDFAVMIRSDFPQNVGTFYRVLDRKYCGPGEWNVETLCHAHWWGGIDPPGSIGKALDADLRPIRDPGDEAQDESKSWLPPIPNDITLEESELLREALTEWVKEKQ